MMSGIGRISLLVFTGALSCKPLENRLSDQPACDLGDTIVFEAETGDVIAIDRVNGAIRWKFKAKAVELAEHDPAPFDPRPSRFLICPMVKTASNDLVLRYEDELYAIDNNGSLLWSIEIPGRWTKEDLRCPTATPDSGVVAISDLGHALLKLDRLGNEVFGFDFTYAGIATAQPWVVPDSGDIVVRTRAQVLNINPSGGLNWDANIASYLFDRPALLLPRVETK